MPTKAPARIPYPTEPATQPTSAPTPTDPAVTPPSNAPAPAGSNDERGLGSIEPSITNLVTAKTGSTAAFFPDFVHVGSARAGRPRPRQRWQRGGRVGRGTAARRPLRARRAEPQRLPAGPAPRAHRLRGTGRRARAAARGRRPPRGPFLRRADRAPGGGPPAEVGALAGGQRAARLRARAREPGGRAAAPATRRGQADRARAARIRVALPAARRQQRRPA